MLKNEITVFLRFAPAEKLFECTVTVSSSFRQILETLKPMISSEIEGKLSMNQKLYIFTTDSWQECDLDVSLRSLGIEHGMEFLII